MLRLQEYEDTLCRCGCGLPIAVAHKSQAFKVDHYTCYAGAALERVRREENERADKANRPEGWDDGRHYFVVRHDEDDEED